MRLKKVNANAGFTFHHKISTDGVAVSMLHSKTTQEHGSNLEAYPARKRVRRHVLLIGGEEGEVEVLWEGEWVWIQEKGVFTMVCEEGRELVSSF